MISGILLDFNGTVVEEDDDVIRAIAEEIATDAPGRSAADIGSMWGREVAAGTAATAIRGFRCQREIVVAALERVLAAVGSRMDAAQACERQFAFWREPALRPGSAEFLEACPIPVCVVSNTDRDDLDAAVRHHGLRLPHVVTSEDVRSYKPAPEIFVAALELLGLFSSEVLHVGDSLTSDVAGANALGIPIAWVDRRGRPLPEGAEVACRITDLRELLPLIESPTQS